MAKAILQDIIAFKDAVIQASLELASTKNWADIGYCDIATKAGVSICDLEGMFPEKIDIIYAVSKKIDSQLQDDFQDVFTEHDSNKDKLFEVIMARFDLLQTNRNAMISMLNAVLLNPKDAFDCLPFVQKTVSTIMRLTAIRSDGIMGYAHMIMISIAYIKLLRDWVKDDSPDLSATMASLDKMLSTMDVLEQKISFF